MSRAGQGATLVQRFCDMELVFVSGVGIFQLGLERTGTVLFRKNVCWLLSISDGLGCELPNISNIACV